MTSWPNHPRGQVAVDCVLLSLIVATTAVCLVDAHGPARLLLVLLAAGLVPGGALLTRLPVDESSAFFGLAVCFSFTIEAIGALVMVWTGWWHPFGFAGVLAIAATTLLLFDLTQIVKYGGRLI